MEKVDITLRIDYEVSELMLEVEGEVVSEDHTTVLLGFMVGLVDDAKEYGGRWVLSTKLREAKRNRMAFTLAFPNIASKEQFYQKLQALDQKTVL